MRFISMKKIRNSDYLSFSTYLSMKKINTPKAKAKLQTKRPPHQRRSSSSQLTKQNHIRLKYLIALKNAGLPSYLAEVSAAN